MINGRADQGESDLQRSILAKNREIQQQILAVDTADDNLQRLHFVLLIFFPSMFFCGEATKKASIDGLKWRDLVMGRWW